MNRQIVSGGLYIEGLRKTKITAFVFLAYILLVQVIIPLLEGINSAGGIPQETGPAAVMAPLLAVPLLWVPIQTLVVFYAFDKRNASDFYQSLPYTRTCLFFSWILSILTVTAGGLLAGTLAGYLIRLAFPNCWILHTEGLGLTLFSFLAAMLFALGCTMLAVSVTGTLLSNIACMALLMFLPRLVMYIIRGMIMNGMEQFLSDTYFLRGLGLQYNSFVFFVPKLFRSAAFGRPVYSYDSAGCGPEIFTLIVALIYLALAAVLFRKRKSETAGRSASARSVQMIIRVAIAFAVSLAGTALLFLHPADEGVIAAIVFYVIALLVFFAYELLTTRSWKNLARILPSLLIVIALNLAVLGGASLAGRALAHKDLDASEIKSVRIIEEKEDVEYYRYLRYNVGRIRLHSPKTAVVVADAYRRELAEIQNGQDPSRTGPTYQRTVAVETGNGIMYRDLDFTEDDLKTIGEELAGSEEYRKAFMDLPEALPDSMSCHLRPSGGVIRISEKNAEALLSVIQNEINEIGFEDWYFYQSTAGYDIAEDYGLSVFYTSAADRGSVQLFLSPVRFPESFRKTLELAYESQDFAKLSECLQTEKNVMDVEVYVNLKKAPVMAQGYGYHYAGDTDSDYLLTMLSDALTSRQKPDESAYMVVNCYAETYTNERSLHWLLPVPEGVSFDQDGQIIYR